MGNDNHSCHYDRCWLPKDNNKYLWQVFFLVISMFFLLKDTTEFSFTSIFLFVFPIMIDIVTTELKSKVCTVIRWIFGVANGIILICCILGLFDVIIDKGDSFALVSTFMFFNGVSIKKTSVAITLATDILVPFIFLISAPSQKTLHTLEKEQAKRKGVKHR